MSGKGRTSDAVWTAFTESLRFVVVPIILIDLVTSNYPQLATTFMPQIEMLIVFFGGMIVVSSTLESAHRPGTYKRLLFGFCALAFVSVWLFVIFGGGKVEFTYGPYFVIFDMTPIVYIIMMGILLKGVLVYMTFSAGRKAEAERARKRRVGAADKKRARAAKVRKVKARPSVRTLAFGNMSSAEYDVTADDAVGYTPAPNAKDLSKGTKICEVCGKQSPAGAYVCKNCGSWFPSESVT